MKNQFFSFSFKSFLATQSLGALNDNFFQNLIILYVVSILKLPNKEEIIFQASFAFTLPFLIFGPWSGYVSDRFKKSAVLKGVKFCEILIMGCGVWAFIHGEIKYLILTLFFMASQSTFFGPAKAAFIPETVSDENISRANGWLEMTTFFSIIAGTALSGALLIFHHEKVLPVSLYCIGFAVLGSLFALGIKETQQHNSQERFPWNPVWALFKNLMHLKKSQGLFLAALGNSYFWLLGLILKSNIFTYGEDLLKLNTLENSLMLAYLASGIALGSILASRLSGKKVELGLVPLGGLGMSFLGLLTYLSTQSYLFTSLLLFGIGIFGGLYIVPLFAFLQFEAKGEERGRILSTVGILNALFLVLGSLFYKLLAVKLQLRPDQIFLVMSGISIFVVIYICTVIPTYFIRFTAWMLAHTFYKIKIKGQENIPFHGKALLLVNHMSFIDALLVTSSIQRFVKFIMFKKIFEIPGIKQFCKIMKVIPIAPYEGRESVEHSLTRASEELKNGEVVCIFPEGAISRTGEIMEFRDGFESINQDPQAPIIPVTLHNVWGSIFSFEGGKVFFKMPKRIPYPITIKYGKALPPNTSAKEAHAIMKKMLEEEKTQ